MCAEQVTWMGRARSNRMLTHPNNEVWTLSVEGRNQSLKEEGRDEARRKNRVNTFWVLTTCKAPFYRRGSWDSEKVRSFLKAPQLVSNQWSEHLNPAGLTPDPMLLIICYIVPSTRILSKLKTQVSYCFHWHIRYMSTLSPQKKEGNQKPASRAEGWAPDARE